MMGKIGFAEPDESVIGGWNATPSLAPPKSAFEGSARLRSISWWLQSFASNEHEGSEMLGNKQQIMRNVA
jgi:hypothetical protein